MISALLKQCGIIFTENRTNQRTLKNLKCPWRTLENHLWRLLKESLTKRVQSALQSKGVHNKYGLKLSFYKLYCWPMFCVSTYVWTCFKKSLYPFTIFLANYKEMRTGSTLLHNTAFPDERRIILSDCEMWFKKRIHHFHYLHLQGLHHNLHHHQTTENLTKENTKKRV